MRDFDEVEEYEPWPESSDYQCIEEILQHYAAQGYFPEKLGKYDILLGYKKWIVEDIGGAILLKRTIGFDKGQQSEITLRRGPTKTIELEYGIRTKEVQVFDAEAELEAMLL